MKILIGLPLYRRAWILPAWFKFIEAQNFPLSDIGFIFELGTDDDATHELLWQWHLLHPEVKIFDGVIRTDTIHTENPARGRNWTKDKYIRMVDFRNSLLDRAICLEPETYFSLDSDILLENPFILRDFYEMVTTGSYDAVSPLSYMKAYDNSYPSVMTWISVAEKRAVRNLINYPLGQTFQSDIIMAAVMMSKDVYSNVRYAWHRQGEDLGWCDNARRKGYKLWCASGYYAAHIMHEHVLGDYLLNGDLRSTNGNSRIILTAAN